MRRKTRLPCYGFKLSNLLLSYFDQAIYGELFMSVPVIRALWSTWTISSVRLEYVPDLSLPTEPSLAPASCRPPLTP